MNKPVEQMSPIQLLLEESQLTREFETATPNRQRAINKRLAQIQKRIVYISKHQPSPMFPKNRVERI